MVNSVVLFVIDGLQQADAPHIDTFVSSGACTYAARAVMPSSTLPCHVSMCRGVPPERHGITTNTWVPPVRPVPSIIDVVHAAGRPTSSFYNWEQLRDLSDPGSLDRAIFLNNCGDPHGDQELAELAASCLKDQGENGFAFVYLGHVDIAGHDYGWMSAEYLRAVERADRAVGTVLEVLDRNRTVCIVTSDHGGHAQTHGTDLDEDLTIPWVIAGPGVPPGLAIQAQVDLIDNPPTIAALLGIEPAPEWTGKVVDEVVQG